MTDAPPGGGARRWLLGVLAAAERRPALLVTALAAALRLAALTSLPLIITNDGAGYATWAQPMLAGRWPDLPVFRTPGYPLLLAGVFAVFGPTPTGVLIVQHALGVATCALVARAAARLAGGRWALVCGLAAAADARLVGMESYLLTESVATFLFVAGVSLALVPARRPIVIGAVAGLALGALCLVRPAFQAAAPLAAAGLVMGVAPGRRAMAAAAVALALVATVAPWVAFNSARGIAGLSGANGVFFWIGAQRAGLLDPAHPLPPGVREAYERVLAPDPGEDARVYRFLVEANAWGDPAVREALEEWRRASVRERPAAWARAIGRGLLWQLDLYPREGFVRASDLRWQLRRLTRGPRRPAEPVNFQFSPEWARTMEPFAMHASPGPLRHWVGWWGRQQRSGVLNLALLAAAMAAGVACLLTRRWGWALVLGATGAYYAMHAVALLPYSRFSLPCWVAWYLAPAVLVAAWRARGASRRSAVATG